MLRDVCKPVHVAAVTVDQSNIDLARFTAIRCLVPNTKVLRDRLPVPASREIATDAHLAESGGKMARYREITLDEMTPAQRRVHDLIVAGRRGRFGGPFQLLIRAPEICEPAAKLGEHLR